MLKKNVGEGSSRSIDGHGRAHSSFTQGASDIPDTLSVEYLLSDDSPRVPFSSSSKLFTHDGGIRISSVTDGKASRNKGFTSVRPYVGPVGHDRGGVTKRGVCETGSESKKLLKFVSGRKDDVMKKFDPITFNRRDSKPVNGLERKDDVMKKFDPITFNRRDTTPFNGLERKDDVMKKFDPITFNRTDSKPVNGLERKDAVMKKFHPITYNQRDSKPINGLERKDDVVKKFHPITLKGRDSKPINGLERKVEVTRKFDPTTFNRRDSKPINGLERKDDVMKKIDLIPLNRRDPKAINGSPKRKSEAISIRDLVSEKKPRIILRLPNKKEVSHIPKMGYNAPKTEYKVSKTEYKVPKTEYKVPKVEDKYKVPNFKEFSFLKSTPLGIPKQSTKEETSGPACSIASTESNRNSASSQQVSTLKTAINSVGAQQVSTSKTPISLVVASQVSTLKTHIDSVGPSQILRLNTPINQMGVGCSRIRPKDERVKLEDAVEDLSQPKTEATLPDGLLAVPLMKHQRIALSWMVNQETKSTSCCGGILADDQGLGKTISTIALILKERSPKSNEAQQSDVNMLNSDEERPPAGTLIVCPTSVLRQWSQELVNKVTPEADLSVLVYHGSNRTKDPVELAKYDVVVTTYALVGQEVPMEPAVNEDDDPFGNPFHRFKKKKQPGSSKKKIRRAGSSDDDIVSGPLGKVGWFRVVLDEAQCTKNHRTMTARACWGLHAKRRWCLSGTPIQNTIEDLYSYFRFLKHDPYAVFRTFCVHIKSEISVNPTAGYKRLQAVLKTFLLRRTKSTRIDGEPIIILPPKTIETLQIEFAKEERAFYKKLESESRDQFKEYAAAGTVRQNYAVILVMLLRLRQACGHPCLVNMLNYNSQKTSSVETAKKLPREKQMSLLNCLESSSLCGICNDSPDDAVVTVCGHVYCHQCICELMIGEDTECPADNCKTNLVMARVFSKDALQAALSDQESVVNEGVSDSRSSTWPQTSSKIKATLKLLLSISKPQRKNETSSETSGFVPGKTIVFSQWTKMLDLLEDSLKEYSIEYRRLDGTMPVTARDKSVKDFNTLPQVTVVIMSLKAACLGLNMVAANNVILMDLWWNPTTEDQAIDRAHRIGQTRPVSVYRLTVKETVEDRILELQREKRNIVASAFGEEGTGGQQTGLTVEELSYLFKA